MVDDRRNADVADKLFPFVKNNCYECSQVLQDFGVLELHVVSPVGPVLQFPLPVQIKCFKRSTIPHETERFRESEIQSLMLTRFCP